MITAYIGVGTNIDREKHVEAAVAELSQIGDNLKLSTVYECPTVGFDSAPFYNLVIELETSMSFTQFTQTLRNIELRWGRSEFAKKFQDRTLDLDVLLFGERVSSEKPELPRSDIFKYPFVIQPLYELCPNRIVPQDGRTIAQIWHQFGEFDSLTPISLWFELTSEHHI
ncbi:2-amino-4-hydroxy-6-hydroxymethyldihydropteridine diphosphokinase [Vibrio sp. SCSIO 43135]|uniref:2-amino-4-hydroxy-6- hydroxymethyldihydropteridine diphosphokinase n=1 Tax=Vibrio sp. SCSIO 43135 TaxID=2819096 RepID=UPI002074BCFC|nr:2-amino-4-hydroxy-6-hydroxymethyldihydropteridine diphosphokinase [Vibrio sp. SCSIO 43135]USD41559.1 2-amino-4-hydroxy-6-hydroxymethyldihydropteridine diphosphokinase [Vibrio sp. SCSIO 43135]